MVCAYNYFKGLFVPYLVKREIFTGLTVYIYLIHS